MHQDIVTVEEKRTSRTLPTFDMLDIMTIIVLIVISILLFTEKQVPEYLIAILGLGAGVKLDPLSRRNNP